MRIWLLLTLCLLAALPARAQEPTTFPLQGRNVAVYFSRKHFQFDDTYRIPLSQFILSDQGKEISIEDLKSQTLISLGQLFCAQLASASQADSVYFLNESPDQAHAFMEAYESDTHLLAPVGEAFAGTDLILVVNPLLLGSYRTTTVYSRSNRLITEPVTVRTARVRMEVFDPVTGLRLNVAEGCMDERFTSVPEEHFQFHMAHSQTGKFLSRLMSLGVTHLNLGVNSNCPAE